MPNKNGWRVYKAVPNEKPNVVNNVCTHVPNSNTDLT